VDEEVAAALRWRLEPFWRPTIEPDAINLMLYVQEADKGADPTPYTIYRDTERIFRNDAQAAVLKHIMWDIQSQVQQRARDFLLLHAGSVASNGGALLLPAPMDAGKSTLTAALLTRGFRYLSDELGAVDPVTTRAYPFPRKIALETSAMDLFPGLKERLQDRTGGPWDDPLDRFVRPEDLGSAVSGPSPIRWLVFPEGNPTGSARLRAISKAEAAQRMARYSFNLHRYEDRGVVLLGRVAADAEAHVLEGGTSHARAELLESLVGGIAR
jgi:hypothetical protein